MKLIQPLLIAILLAIAFGCNKDKAIGSNEILGKWKLIEEKEWWGTPGPDEFQPVQSNKKIVFSKDGTFQSNGDMCFMSSESNSQSSGFFYESLSSLEPEGCQSTAPSSGIKYVVDGKYLIITYPCIEVCRQKYERI